MTNQIFDRRTVAIPGPAGDASPEMLEAARLRVDQAIEHADLGGIAARAAEEAVKAADLHGIAATEAERVLSSRLITRSTLAELRQVQNATPFTLATVTGDTNSWVKGLYAWNGSSWVQVWGDSGWRTVTTFLNGWRSSTNNPVRYRRIGAVVYLSGQALLPTVPLTGSAAFELLSGYRPPGTVALSTAYLLSGRVEIRADGRVYFGSDSVRNSENALGHVLEGISFITDQ